MWSNLVHFILLANVNFFFFTSRGHGVRDCMVVDIKLSVQSVPITTQVSSNPVHDEVYSILHYVIKIVSDLRQVGLWFSSGTLVSSTNETDRHDIDIAEILLKVALNTVNTHFFK